MAITRIGAASGDGTTIALPGSFDNGDLAVIFAFRSAITAPTIPAGAGWTSLTGLSSGASSFRLGWKILTGPGDDSGTWTNATGLVCQIYRGQANNKPPIILGSSTTGTGVNITYGAINPLTNNGSSWIGGMAGTKTTTATLETPPTNMTNVTNNVGAANEYSGHDTNGIYTVGNGIWPTTIVGVGVSAEWRAVTFEILAGGVLNYNNYSFGNVKDGMVGTDKAV